MEIYISEANKQKVYIFLLHKAFFKKSHVELYRNKLMYNYTYNV